MPNNRHGDPSAKETLRKDIISVQRQRPQNQGCDDVYDEEDGSDAQPFAHVAERFGRHGVDDVV